MRTRTIADKLIAKVCELTTQLNHLQSNYDTVSEQYDDARSQLKHQLNTMEQYETQHKRDLLKIEDFKTSNDEQAQRIHSLDEVLNNQAHQLSIFKEEIERLMGIVVENSKLIAKQDNEIMEYVKAARES